MIRHAAVAGFILLLQFLLGTPARELQQNVQPSRQEQSSPQQQSATPSLGQISGYIYRADTGEPLDNATVVLRSSTTFAPLQSTRTVANGSYAIADVLPDSYWVFAYRPGFLIQRYGDDPPDPYLSSPRNSYVVTIGPGQKLDAIDLRLIASASIATLPDEGQEVASHTTACRFCARFSPDGAFLALGTGYGTPAETKVWLYEMRSKRLVPVTLNLQGMPRLARFGLDVRWFDDDTLYLKYGEFDQDLRFFKLSGVKAAWGNDPSSLSSQEVADVPAEVAIDFHRGAEQRNDRYIVTMEPYGHMSSRLTMRLTGGTGTQSIADNVYNFLFDKNRSLVFYQKFEAKGTIVTFDLKTRRYRYNFVPNLPLGLMAQVQDGTGSLVVYHVRGPCQPDGSFFESEIQGIHPTDRELALPRHVCIAKLP